MIKNTMHFHRSTRTRDEIRLRRTVRVALPLHAAGGSSNGHNARPAPAGFALFYEFDAVCKGKPDPETGYLTSIKDIDNAFERAAMPVLRDAFERDRRAEHPTAPQRVLKAMFTALADRLDAPLVELTWRTTPNQSMTTTRPETDSENQTTPAPDTADAVLLRERFEFAAAHRLCVPERDQDENRSIFGKCANPHYHGHNYVLETCVRVPASVLDQRPMIQSDLAARTDESVINTLDHANLNIDVPAFDQEQGGRIPSVENIVRFCHETLAPRVEELGCELVHATVWETERTSARYPA